MRLDVLATPPLRLVFRNRNLFCAWDLHALGHEGRDLLGWMSTRPLLVMTEAQGDRRPSGQGQPSPPEAKALQTEATSEGSLQTEDISEGSLASSDSEPDQALEQGGVPKHVDGTAASGSVKSNKPKAASPPIPPAKQ